MPDHEDYDAGDWDDEDDEFEGFEIDDGLDIGFEHESDEIWPLLEKFGLVGHDDDADVGEGPQLTGKHDPRWEITQFPFRVIHACEKNLLSDPASRVGRGLYRCPACKAKISEKEVEEIVGVPQKQTAKPSRTDEESAIPASSESESPGPEAKSTPAGSSQRREERLARLLQATGHSVGLGRMEKASHEQQQIQNAAPNDPLLHYLLLLAEIGIKFSFTINMSGRLLSGQLVGAEGFFSALKDRLIEASGVQDNSERRGVLAIQSIFAEQAQAEHDKRLKSLTRLMLADRAGKELPDIEPPSFIHLLDVRIGMGDEVVTLPAWRGRVSAIDGYTLGQLISKNDAE